MLLLLALPLAAGAAARPAAEQAFVAGMQAQHGFDPATVETLLGAAERRDDILEAISTPAEALPWHRYRPIFLTQARIDAGLAYWEQHADTLAAASARFGVPAEIIVAILGVETFYGRYQGRYRVLDALYTLGFHYPPRADFFRRELASFLRLCAEEGLDPTTPMGSYAGAMGLPQFISSSYRHYAVDFDADGQRDIWANHADAIGSIASYLQRHGWQRQQPIAAPITPPDATQQALLGSELTPGQPLQALRAAGLPGPAAWPDDLAVSLVTLQTADGPAHWLTTANFYAITRYNHSPLYAMAVHQLGEALRQRRTVTAGAPPTT